jgi:solute carrier family 25 oxoglutarate transporter 11
MSSRAEVERLKLKAQLEADYAATSREAPVTKPPPPSYVKTVETIKPFVFGGFSGICATSCIQPLDTIKVRIQLMGEGVKGGPRGSLIGTGSAIIRDEGFMALYSGYSAAVLRQAVYGTARLGLFRTFSDKLQVDAHSPLPFYQKAACGLASGALGALIGNPADLSLVRMQADGSLPVDRRRNYKGVFNALSRIVKEEGVTTLWRGSLPTVYRAMAMNCGMLATYDQSKEMLVPFVGTGTGNNLLASVISGIVAAVVTLPFDMMKTRIQRMHAGPDGKMPYKGVFDCGSKIVKSEGPFALWKGLGTFCVRVAPHACITLLVNDWLNFRFGVWRKTFA